MIDLPFDAPPLRSNDRKHWSRRARDVKQIRAAAFYAARGITGPIPAVVTIVWTVTDRRRRDAGASSPTLKAAIDGMVDAHVWPDDSLAYVAEERCRIEIGDERGLRIEVDAA